MHYRPWAPRWMIGGTFLAKMMGALAATDLIPGSQRIVAAHSGHYIQLDEPQLVIDAIQSVVEPVRSDQSARAVPQMSALTF